MLLDFTWQHHNTDMLPTMWAQKINKLDDIKKFSILKKGNRDGKSKKLWKQGRGRKAQKLMREWKQDEDRAQGSF